MTELSINSKERQPLISVIMPVYNGEKYLAEAIESILDQTYKNFEFIIINDGSIDDTEKIILEFKKKDQRVKYISLDNNSGISEALNRGIKLATGEYIARMDCDDFSTETRFSEQIEYLTNNPNVDVLGSYFCLFYEDKKDCRIVPAYALDIYNGKPPVHHPTCMLKRKIFIEYGHYNSEFNNAEDVELWFRWFSQGVKFSNLPKVLYQKRIHEGSVSIAKMRHQFFLLLKINILAITKYKLRFSLKGYLHIAEQILYLVYLLLRLDKIYTRDKKMYSVREKAEII